MYKQADDQALYQKTFSRGVIEDISYKSCDYAFKNIMSLLFYPDSIH